MNVCLSLPELRNAWNSYPHKGDPTSHENYLIKQSKEAIELLFRSRYNIHIENFRVADDGDVSFDVEGITQEAAQLLMEDLR